MTFPAIPGTCLFLFLLVSCMAAHTLVVKSLLQIESGLRTMTSRTTDVLISFLQFTFIQNILPVLVDMMAVLAGQSCFDMAIVRKGHRRSCSSSGDAPNDPIRSYPVALLQETG